MKTERRCERMSDKKEKSRFPTFKKRKLKGEKILIKKEHKEVVAPPGE
jgi:hypothetical protein